MKKLAQAYVLIFRGAKSEGASILKTAKELAIKYELAAELLIINHLTREALYSFTTRKSLAVINSSIRNNLQVWSDILRSEELSFYVSFPQLKQELQQEGEEGFEDRMIEELKLLFEKSGTARIGFWYYMAATEFHIKYKDFNRVLELSLDFLKLVEGSPSIMSKNNIAGVNQTIGVAQMELRNFSAATYHLSISEKLFPVSGFNRLQCLQLLAFSNAALKDFDNSNISIEKALKHARINVREHAKPQWLFIKSSVEFLQGDVDLSFKTLNSEGYLMRQQDEWNLQFRLLEMMQLIAMKDEEWLEFKLDATRKFLTRHKNLDSLRTRLSIDLISNLLRKELDFSQISEKNRLLLNLCSEEAEGYEWNPMSPEIVRFDKWVLKQIPNQDTE
ncbi:MAG: hypothetical protein K9G46_15575 [Flavobacteriales bacterium]|nr:hypothetical protein [Flavobacteriales bacterium]